MGVIRYFLDGGGKRFEPLRSAAARHLERTHHAKVVSATDARRLIRIDAPIDYRDLESVVPYPVARDIVLDASAPIALAECACRKVADRRGDRDSACGPLETCLYVGDPIASFVAEKQHGARLVTAEEALAVVEGAAARGNVHTLWFKDAAAGRMYAICNCCRCCCIGLKSDAAGFSPLAGSGYVAAVDRARCTSCGNCVGTCAFSALALPGGVKPVAIDAERCLGCGACVAMCPERALRLEVAENGPQPVPWSAGAD